MRHLQANIELQIEELVLHDLPYDQRHRVAAAIEQALARLLAERGAPPGFTEGMPPIEGGTVRVNPNLTAESMGMQVADSIYGQWAAGIREPGAAMSQAKG
jgi:hypothetical protein